MLESANVMVVVVFVGEAPNRVGLPRSDPKAMPHRRVVTPVAKKASNEPAAFNSVKSRCRAEACFIPRVSLSSREIGVRERI